MKNALSLLICFLVIASCLSVPAPVFASAESGPLKKRATYFTEEKIAAARAAGSDTFTPSAGI